MNVNSFDMAFRNPKLKLFAAFAASVCTIFFLAAVVIDRLEVGGISKRASIAVRTVGHELLLRAGDSTSLVRPVREKSEGVFLVEFEKEFAFQPDTLIAIVQRVLDKTGLSRYSVTVNECHSPAVVYGFEINSPDSMVPCRGRRQPKACYTIEIAFADFPKRAILNSQIALMTGGILSALATVLIGSNFDFKGSNQRVRQNVSPQHESNPTLTIGKFIFDGPRQQLIMDDEKISLTDKECKILTLLNGNIGRLTLREELIQQVWTDEGVITGRSLDMFISKLRKKISGDPALRITNVHGKGYRLEIL